MTENDMVGVPVEILLVEDNPGDVELTRQGFLAGRLANRLHVATTGDEPAVQRLSPPHPKRPAIGAFLADRLKRWVASTQQSCRRFGLPRPLALVQVVVPAVQDRQRILSLQGNGGRRT